MKTKFAFLFALFLSAHNVWAQETPKIHDTDRIRLAEAFRIGETLTDRVWKDWDKTPFAVLLVTPEYEFLIRHPRPSKDFTSLGYDSTLKSDVYFRKRTQPTNLLATFPAVGGVSTIVIGQAENTSAKTSSPWVVTMLHEHFHQLQASQPNYYAEVNALNLSHGDQTGMWMLNFAFPYSRDDVKQQFSALSKLLMDALHAKNKSDFKNQLDAYLEARQNFQKTLSPDDYKYFSFQLWQEGIARYTEYRIAKLAAKHKPGKAFRSLKDYTPFENVAKDIESRIFKSLAAMKLEESQRVAFYPFGAGEGLLLDEANPKWHDHYFMEKFYVDRYFSNR